MTAFDIATVVAPPFGNNGSAVNHSAKNNMARLQLALLGAHGDSREKSTGCRLTGTMNIEKQCWTWFTVAIGRLCELI